MALSFEEAQAQAIRESTCFCKCGCRISGVAPANLFGRPLPGSCPACRRGTKGHERIATPGMYDVLTNPVEEDELFAPRPRTQRVVSDEQRRAAEAYAEKVGPEVGPSLARLVEKVEDDEELTPTQVEALLRSKRADERAAETARKRLLMEHQRIGKAVDLVSLRIPDSLRAGPYAVVGDNGDVVRVDVERPIAGEMSGWVVVKMDLGEGVPYYGVQKPKRLWSNPAYRGWFPQLVAKVIENPGEARVRYNRLMGVV